MEIESRRHTQTRGPLFALLDVYKPYLSVGGADGKSMRAASPLCHFSGTAKCADGRICHAGIALMPG